jgi:hypothetical protein
MSNENQTPAAAAEPSQNKDTASPFLTEPLPQGAPQGQQQSLEQRPFEQAAQMAEAAATLQVKNSVELIRLLLADEVGTIPVQGDYRLLQEIQRIIMAGGNSIDIAEQAAKEGVKTLRQSGLLKVKQGVTSLDEVLSTTNE